MLDTFIRPFNLFLFKGVQFDRRYDIEDTEWENYLQIADDNNILLEVLGYNEYELDIYARLRLLAQLLTGIYDTPSIYDKGTNPHLNYLFYPLWVWLSIKQVWLSIRRVWLSIRRVWLSIRRV